MSAFNLLLWQQCSTTSPRGKANSTAGPKLPINYIAKMKKKRRNKSKLALDWKDGEKYSPLMVLRHLPHTGETKIIRAPIAKAVSRPQQQRHAA
jgi:hypothetical protein